MATENKTEAAPERFEDILARLRGLVERLEGGNLPLEDSLRAFEEGMELCRRGTVILDGAEKKVETLLAGGPHRAVRSRSTFEDLANGDEPAVGIAGRTGSPRGARSSTACSRRAWRRPPTAIPAACSKRCATRCWRPASASARCWRWPRPRRSAPVDDDVRLACAAVELVHCYSLIHDDLPAMDDDDFRRGRPSNHKVFGEATAILAGDALLTLAFEWIAEAGERAGRPAGVPARASRALGRRRRARSGWCAARPAISASRRRRRWRRWRPCTAEKTGALFRAALEVGGCRRRRGARRAGRLARFGTAYGIAFQHADDIADAEHAEHAAAARARLEAPDRRGHAPPIAPLGPRADRLVELARALARRFRP